MSMTLLEFARGPALNLSLAIFVLGVVFRLVWLAFLPRAVDRSVARGRAGTVLRSAIGGFVSHMWPAKEYRARTMFSTVTGYVFHFGLAIIILFYAQHILVIEDLTGLKWGGLPTGIITIVSVITLAALLAMLVRRLTNPVLKTISTFTDYWSWFVTTLPVATGLLAMSHMFARYETLLAVHILSVCLLLVSFPFGKLMHAFLVFATRFQTTYFYSRRGSHI